MLYAGIDEAGYGPMFGPLCAGVSVFEIDGEEPPCLWDALKVAVTRGRRDARGRIAVEDSKKLKGAGATRHPLLHLERGVLSFMCASRSSGDWIESLDDTDVFNALDVSIPETKWYEATTTLPVGRTKGELRIDAARLRRTMDSARCRCIHLGASVLGAGEFNRRVKVAKSKATVNFEQIVGLIDQCWRRAADRRITMIVDHLGGRTAYLDDLRLAWPDARRRVVEETPTRSRYLLELPNRAPMDLHFCVEADHHHLPVALASMTAKFIRELLMIRLNRFFATHRRDLRPTAGYVEDGRRFLADIEDLLEPVGIDRHDLIRSC